MEPDDVRGYRILPAAPSGVISPSYVLGSKLVTASLPLHLMAALSYALVSRNTKGIRVGFDWMGSVIEVEKGVINSVSVIHDHKDLAASTSLSNSPRYIYLHSITVTVRDVNTTFPNHVLCFF